MKNRKGLSTGWQVLIASAFLIIVIFWLLASQVSDVQAIQVPIYSQSGDERILLTLEVADTALKQQFGLKGEKEISQSYGMLYAFEAPARKYINTKDMRFSTDFMFIDKDNKIVKILENAMPCYTPTCPLYDSIYDVLYIVQVNSGIVQENGIVIGDIVDIRL